MNVNFQSASSQYVCASCKQTFPEDKIETFDGPESQKIYLCAQCEGKVGACYVCQEKVVEVNDVTLTGSFDIMTCKDATTSLASLCQDCARNTTCIACKTSLAKEGMKGLPSPRTLLKGEAFLCGLCRASAEICPECNDVMVLFKREPYEDSIEVSQTNGVSVWLCAQCGDGKKFSAQCICGTSLFNNGQRVVPYEPEKLNNRISICEACGKRPRTLCNGCQKNVVAIQMDKGITLIEKSKTYDYTELTMCLECWSGAQVCTCLTPVVSNQGTLLLGAKVYVTEFVGKDYRCKFCNTLPVVDDEPDAAHILKETLYDKIYSWFTTPNSGLGLSINGNRPTCLMFGINALLQKESGMTNGYYDPITKNICILRAVTPVRFITAFAHELTHFWQDQQGLFDKQSKKICEGFAEWVAYTCLTTMLPNFTDERDKREAARRLERLEKNLVPEYREGLQYFRQIEATKNRNAVILEAQKAEEED